MQGLMLHCGGRECTREDLDDCTVPQGTETWRPIGHRTIVETMLEGLDRVGLKVKREQHGVLDREVDGRMVLGARYFGILDLESELMPGVTTAVGLRNSVDKSMTAGAAIGERVFVCDNLAFTGDIVVMRKHTRFIMRDLRAKIWDACDRLPGFEQVRQEQLKRLRQTECPEPVTNDVIIRALDAGALPASQIPKVLHEARRELNLEEQAQFVRGTAWHLYNSFTEVAKGQFKPGSMAGQNRTVALNKVFADVFLN